MTEIQTETETQPRVHVLSPEEFHATKAKIDKLNARAKQRGFTGLVDLVHATETLTNTASPGHPLPNPHLPRGAEYVVYLTQIIGEAPSYGGWQFLATLDHRTTADGESNWIVRTAPGVSDEMVDRSTLRPTECDHCKVNRFRSKVYLVLNEETGEYLQVGSTCIKDFLGWSTNPVFIYEDEIQIERHSGSGTPTPHFTPRYVLTVALATADRFGWVSKATAEDRCIPSTAARMGLVMFPFPKMTDKEKQMAEEIRSRIPAAEERVDAVMAAVLKEFENEVSGYGANLTAALRAEYVTPREIALTASAVAVIERMNRAKAQREAETQRKAEALPVPTGRETVTGEVLTLRWDVNQYNGDSVLKMLVQDDRGFRVWGTCPSSISEKAKQGSRVSFTATLKPSDKDHLFGFSSRPSKAEVIA